jgi:CBS domain-containing protein
MSERDVIAALAKHGPDCLTHAVETAMTQDVLTCTPDTTIVQLMNQMTERRIRHLPVIDDGRLAGVVSIGDVVKYRIAEAVQEANQLREYITA